MSIHDERPDLTRGWMIVSKQSYWPLCYEALEQIEKTRALIGTGDRQEVAAAFEKSGAWLNLAASAANLGGQGGIQGAADRMSDVAQELSDTDAKISDERLTDLTTLALVCVAKSHVVRAEAPDTESASTKSVALQKPKEKKPELKEIEKEIAAERRERDLAQYRYDTLESRRHLTAAQEYLKAAIKAGHLELKDPSVMTAIPEVPAVSTKAGEMVLYADNEIRPLIKSLGEVVENQRLALVKKLDN
ncbi:MAG: hypothetical protein KDB00_03610 [Planctomycetales bacterium]|nr:hypothetical protein [Planctomycetales bacterium]